MSAASSNVTAGEARASGVVHKPSPEAAGGLVWREGSGEPELLLVFRDRAKASDWSFPKGKREEGESLVDAALREVAEETGVTGLIVGEAGTISYPVSDRSKAVAFFHMYATDDEPTALASDATFATWVPVHVARVLLTHEEQRNLLASVSPPPLRGHGGVRSRIHAGLESPERARLSAETEVLRSKLRPVEASSRTLVDRAAREARSGDLDRGWKLLHEARRRMFDQLDATQMELEAMALEQEARAKLSGWRKDAVVLLARTVRQTKENKDERNETNEKNEKDEKNEKEDKAAAKKRAALVIATRIRDEHSDNIYFSNRLLRKQMAPIAVILAVALLGLGAHDHKYIFPMLLGACGACLSALITFARSTTRLKIPDHLANVWVTLMRPLIGAASGLVAFLFLDSGLIKADTADVSYLFFAFGFSERFVLAAIEGAAGTVEKKG